MLYCQYNDPFLHYYFIDKRLFNANSISMIFVLLTSFLSLLCLLYSRQYSEVFSICFLLLNLDLVLFFTTDHLLLFYIFLEFSLIPVFFIIGIWGSEGKIYSSFKFILYTVVGSISFLVAIIYTYNETNTLVISDLSVILTTNLDIGIQKLLWLAFFISFAVKIPMIPFHTWLPFAHVQAPASGSAMLAGILIKMGGYGMLKILLPVFPNVSVCFSDYVIIMSVVAVIFASCVAFVQDDIKKVIAYSSVAHMGLVTGGMFSLNTTAINAAVFQMISHGLISSGLFFCIGMLYDRSHTREIKKYSGLAVSMPVFSTFFIILSMSSLGLPGTSGFIGEMFSIVGIIENNIFYGSLSATSVVLTAGYMIWLSKQIIWGSDNGFITNDISRKEIFILVSLVIPVIFLGIYPQIVFSLVKNHAMSLLLVR
ncbi:MAG: NADH-quinone oxidoreductase chain M [Candidatus Xenolissoclinum pacificiensis L6]|uniref:NADH-quinone oxidoreductase chain M n=1 Tax=Candidatus Xenolissoclinum pacificiensis L6 TaxID=1401685 RepID=W2V2X1_9RICK|nr:MAG: NADH-quinone oxidoreductase chain M [Candidatus Xenolissoclinum pacificiensis L6]